jgi:hypothetical protein
VSLGKHTLHYQGIHVMLTISEVWIFSLLQKPLYLGMFFGCAGEGATQEAQFECQTIFSDSQNV